MKKLAATVTLALTVVFGAASVASAQSVQGGTIESDSDVQPGETVRLRGTCPGATSVDVTFDGRTFTDVPVDENGNWVLDVTAPSTPGSYTATSSCGGTTIVEVLGSVPTALPRTGQDSSVPLARIGIAAVAGGGALLAVSRRRRTVNA